MLPLMLLFGVTMDYFAFKTIDTVWAFVWLGFHLMEAPIVIVFIHWYDTERSKLKMNLHPYKGMNRFDSLFGYVRVGAPLLLQMSFGALLNASFVFYWFSASFSVSWPFFLIVVLLMISNDVFRHYFEKPRIQMGVYYFACFSILALMIPYLMNSMNPEWFVTAGGVAFVIVFVFGFVLTRIAPHLKKERGFMVILVIGIFAVMNALYFSNLIPPIPLSLREADVYHSITRQGDEYHVTDEDRSFFDQFDPEETVHILKSDRVFAFSSVFAPSALNTQIFHEWQHYDPEREKWMTESRYGYYITGGRQAGYRGYSVKANVEPGKWRVNVETARGQVLARVRFKVEVVDQLPKLIEEVR